MVCTCYNKVLWLPLFNKTATGGRLGQKAKERVTAKPCGLYTADF